MIDKVSNVVATAFAYALWPVSAAGWATVVAIEFAIGELEELGLTLLDVWDERPVIAKD